MSKRETERLADWAEAYLSENANRLSSTTLAAKRRDLDQFLAYFAEAGLCGELELWTRGITEGFLSQLEHGAKRRPASINRILWSLRHFAAWIHERRAFRSGQPTAGIHELFVAEPAWKGLSKAEVTALRASLQRLTKQRCRKNQRPLRDRAIVLLLLATGLRVTELLEINREQYDGRAFRDVARKGGRISTRVPIPREAREALDRYISEERGFGDGAIFTSNAGLRLERQHVDRVLKLVSAGVKRGATEPPPKPLSARELRHTALRSTTRKRGVESGMRKGGHSSQTYVWRYIRLSEEERQVALERLRVENS